MRRIDRDAIERRGVPARLLMETAGQAVASAIQSRFSSCRRPLIACGGGNNGGDGFVVARALLEQGRGVEPRVLALAGPEGRSPEAAENFDLLLSSEVEVLVVPDLKDIERAVNDSDLIVDAVFGVGLTRPVEGSLAAGLCALGGSGRPVLAVDLPSGSSSETGAALGVELEPDVIVTLGLPKLGLALRARAAEVQVADIGLPATSIAEADIRQHVLTERAAASRLPARPLDGHKGTFGHVLVIAGSEGKTGAAALAAEGALRAGAGLVTVAVPRSLSPILEGALREAMTRSLEDAGSGRLVEGVVDELSREVGSREAAVIGPGLGTHPESVRALERLLPSLRVPTVLDADALNAFAGRPEALCGEGPRVLTPHPGEMGRLLDRTPAQVQADRLAAARELASRTGAIVALKGARTVVAAPDGSVLVNPTGGPGLATAGSGDVLAGVIGALLGQGVGPLDAAALGAYLHGLAGESLGPVGGLAGEIAGRLPGVWRRLSTARSETDDCGDLRRFP